MTTQTSLPFTMRSTEHAPDSLLETTHVEITHVEITRGTLLRGQIHYAQFIHGYRTSLEPILMAAAIPAKSGQSVLEIGCGAGAGLLCLLKRTTGVHGTGIEQDAATAELARHNLRENGWHNTPILTASFPEACTSLKSFDHCMANPPWHPRNSSSSPTPRRDLARRLGTDTLSSWIHGCASILRHKGSLTLSLPATLVAQAITALQKAQFGDITLYPFWPQIGKSARITLIRARLGLRSPSRIMAGMVLHEADGSLTKAARSVLDNAAPLPGLHG